MAAIVYLSPEWYKREVERLGQQLLNAQRDRRAVQVRNWMLVEYIASRGLDLDEVEMRAEYADRAAGHILRDNDRDRLEEFRCTVVQLVWDVDALHRHAKNNNATVNVVKILDVLLKAVHKAVNTCAKRDMSAAEAREQAEKSLASIPNDVPRQLELTDTEAPGHQPATDPDQSI